MTVATTPPLALSNLINISVTVAPTAASANSFNQGLFIANSGVIPTYGAGARLQQFSSTTAMLSAGFTVNDSEYIAAQIYFDQTPAPAFIWIGAQNPTALGTITIDGRTVADGVMSSSVNPTHISSATAAFVSGDVGSTIIVEGAGAAGAALITTISSITSGTVAVLAGTCLTTVAAAQTSIGPLGSGYHALDTVTVTQAGASYGTVQIVTVGISGQVLTAQVLSGSQGTGYTVANNLPTVAVSPSTGSGFEVNITVVGESLLQAATACRAASSSWYGLAVYNPVDADNLALAEWADALWQNTRYYAWSADTAIANGTVNNLALQLQTLELRVMGIYATTQGGLYPNNIYAAAGLMGVDMGLNTGLANSFFTLAHKQIAGIATELVTQTQYTNIKSAGFNVYGNFSPYQFFEPGFMSNGAPSYLWLYLAMLVNNLQIDILNVLDSLPAVPQTNSGEQLLINGANTACAYLASIGFIAPSTWQEQPVLNLATGQALPAGYLNQAQPYALQSAGNRAAGDAQPIYCCITTAGAVQSLVIGVYTQL